MRLWRKSLILKPKEVDIIYLRIPEREFHVVCVLSLWKMLTDFSARFLDLRQFKL
jgi:hypothetical protein